MQRRSFLTSSIWLGFGGVLAGRAEQTRPALVKPRRLRKASPAARNTLDSARIPRASKLLICGLFQKDRVLAQDGVEPICRMLPIAPST